MIKPFLIKICISFSYTYKVFLQFVNFTEIMSKNINQARKDTEFALAALMEIPAQYNATLELGILGYGIPLFYHSSLWFIYSLFFTIVLFSFICLHSHAWAVVGALSLQNGSLFHHLWELTMPHLLDTELLMQPLSSKVNHHLSNINLNQALLHLLTVWNLIIRYEAWMIFP